MTSSLLNLVDNLAEGDYKIKGEHVLISKTCKPCSIKYKDCECCPEYPNTKDDSIPYKLQICSLDYQKRFDGNLQKRFANT